MSEDRVLICGSRNWDGFREIDMRVAALPPDAIVISGRADGADMIAAKSARSHGLFVAEVACTDEHWERYRKRAGFLRNLKMLDLEPDLVIAFTTGSPGTQLTIDEARRRGIPIEIHGPNPNV